MYEDDPNIEKPQTFFTKYFVDLVETGIPGQPAGLRLKPLFIQLKENLARDGRPTPSDRNIDAASDFVFAHNAAPRETQRNPELEIQRLRAELTKRQRELAKSQQKVSDLQERVHQEGHAEDRRELNAAVEQAEHKLSEMTEAAVAVQQELHGAEHANKLPKEPEPVDPLSAQPQISAQNRKEARNTDLRSATGGRAQARIDKFPDVVTVDPDLAARVRFYSSDRGLAEIIKRPPKFADERYRRLVQVAKNAENMDAVLELAQISRQHHHLESEACWLGIADRWSLSPRPETAFQRAQVYRRAGLEEFARAAFARAAMYGYDDAVREFLSWSDRTRELTLKEFSGRLTVENVLIYAADAGSVTAMRELGIAAHKAGQFQEAVKYLQDPALINDAYVMYLLGASLLSLGERRIGRAWLRKAGRKGDRNAELEFARTSVSNRPIKSLVSRTTSEFDSGSLHVGDDIAIGQLLELAECCSNRGLTESAIECLQRAAKLGSRTSMIRLGRLYFDSGQLNEASRWFESGGWGQKIPDATSRELVFQLACRLSWAGDDEASERWLAAAADAGHARASEILAGVRHMPRKQRQHLRLTLPPSALRVVRVAADLRVGRSGLLALGTVAGVLGIAALCGGAWLIFNTLINVLNHTTAVMSGIPYQLVGAVIIYPGLFMVATSVELYRNAIARRRLPRGYRR